MTVSQDEIRRCPERVIILDADDPMTEVEGRFVWQEEHDRVVEETRRAAFQEGYSAGLRDADRGQQPASVQLELRRRRSALAHVRLWLFALGMICLLIALPVLVFGA